MTPKPSTTSSGQGLIRAAERSLYDLLGEPAPAGAVAGETKLTKKQETVDEDESLHDHESYD